MKILGTGLSGMVGSQLVTSLKASCEFENISRAEGVNILDKDTVFEKISQSSSPVVVHLAAKADVDGCEKDKSDGEKGEAWQINVIGTQNVAFACEQTGKKIIYISTDFVFDGENAPEDGYTEEEVPNPINWYGVTKYEGEKVIQKNSDWLILRIAYPYGNQLDAKDFVHTIGKRLKSNQNILAVTDHIFTPTYILDIARAIEVLIQNNAKGVYHIVGSQFLSPYDASLMIAKRFQLDNNFIQQTTREVFFRDRAKRPFQLKLKNGKIDRLGVFLKTFEEGLSNLESI